MPATHIHYLLWSLPRLTAGLYLKKLASPLVVHLVIFRALWMHQAPQGSRKNSPPCRFGHFTPISIKSLHFAHLFQTSPNIAPTLEGSNPASKDRRRRLRRLDLACILMWVFASLYSVLCSHSTHCGDLSHVSCTFCLPVRAE